MAEGGDGEVPQLVPKGTADSEDGEFQAMDQGSDDVPVDNDLPASLQFDTNSSPPPGAATLPLGSQAQADTVTYSGPVEGAVLEVKPRGQSKLQAFKHWSHYQMKCTRQLLNEKLGRSAKTVDLSVESQVETLRNTQKKFTHLLFLSQQLASAMQSVADTQRALCENFAYLSVKSPELGTEFDFSSRIQKAQSKHSDELVRVILAFHQKMDTLVHKTMEDTLLTVKQYDAARLSYDASRTAVEKAQEDPPTTPNGQAKFEAMVAEFESEKAQFERLRSDLDIKLKLLNSNKVYCRIRNQGLCKVSDVEPIVHWNISVLIGLRLGLSIHKGN